LKIIVKTHKRLKINFKLPDPTTTKRKNPNKTGPTGNLSSFFFYNLKTFYFTVKEAGTFPLFSMFF